MALLRRETLPPEVRARLSTADKPLASAPTADDTWVVATRSHLVILSPDGQVQSHPWTDVDRARLDGESEVLSVHWVDGSPVTELALRTTARRLAVVLRERVQHSVLHTEQVELPGGGRARVALRRAADDSLFSQVIGTGRTNLADPAVARAIDAAEARVRAAAGLPL